VLRRAQGEFWQFTHVLGYRFSRDEERSPAVLRTRLGRWLHTHVLGALGAHDAQDGEVTLGQALEHSAALLRADPDQQLWDVLGQGLLYDVADRLETIGRLDLTGFALRAVAEWFARFPADVAKEPRWLRERGVLVRDQGDVLREKGNLDGALDAYRESLAIRKRLAQADPSNATWQRDLSISHNNVGNVLRDQGNLDGALDAYRDSLAIARRLAQADPSNATWQRDLSFCFNRLAECLELRGAQSEAVSFAEESLAIDERLAALDSSHAVWQRDVAVSRALVTRLRGAVN
jgi:tetratricopeptide (TPR) repeat protein